MRALLNNFNGSPGATDAAIADAESKLHTKLPGEYVDFLKMANGGEGFVGKNYVIIWGVQDLAAMDDSYEIQKYVPGLLVFGSSGGGDAYGFDIRGPQWQIVRVPFVGMQWDVAEPIASSFGKFLCWLDEES